MLRHMSCQCRVLCGIFARVNTVVSQLLQCRAACSFTCLENCVCTCCAAAEICDGRGGKLCDTCISGMEAVRTDFKAKLADLQHCNSWATNSANLTNALLHDVQMQAVQLAKMVMQLASPCLDGVDSLSLYLNESTATDPLGVCQVAGAGNRLWKNC